MEGLGSHYVVLLNDPQLRKGLEAPVPSGRGGAGSRAARRVGIGLARFLHALAVRADPSVPSLSPFPLRQAQQLGDLSRLEFQ